MPEPTRKRRWSDEEVIWRHWLAFMAPCVGLFLAFSRPWRAWMMEVTLRAWAFISDQSLRDAAPDLYLLFEPAWMALLSVFLLGSVLLFVAGKSLKWSSILLWRWRRPVAWTALGVGALTALVLEPINTLMGIAATVVVGWVYRHFENQRQIINELARRRDRQG